MNVSVCIFYWRTKNRNYLYLDETASLEKIFEYYIRDLVNLLKYKWKNALDHKCQKWFCKNNYTEFTYKNWCICSPHEKANVDLRKPK